MYSLKEFWQIRNLPEPEGEWDGNVICLETNAEWSFGANQTHGFLSCYIYINQLLLMEATFLLRQTSLSITQISDQLHFAEVTTFARFFNRMKGMNPREFRKGK